MNSTIYPSKFFYLSLLKKLRRETARYDIIYFAKYYLGHMVRDEMPFFHKEIYSLLQKENRLGIAAPRGFAKSTLTQIIYGLHCLLFNEGEDIVSISASADLADEWVRKIKMELENNEKIKQDFGAVFQWGDNISKRWTHNHLIIHKGEKVFSQIRSRGRGCQIRGFRPTKVFCDDLEDDELVRSEDRRKELREWFLGALLNVLRVDQQIIFIGTILHPLSLIAKIIGKRDEFVNWETKKYKAITDGKSIWEERFPLKDLLKRKFEIGTYAFEAEFQNNPIASDICLWRPEWIKTYEKIPKIKETFIAVDPATSLKESADYWGIVVWGIGYDNRIYELESIKGRWGTWDAIDRLIRLYQKYEPLRMGVEKEKIEMIMKPVLLKEARKRGVYMRLVSLELGKYKEGQKRVSRDKFARAMTIIPLFENDFVRVRSQDLIDQISVFPTGDEDDLVDAAVHGLHLIQRYSAKANIFKDLFKTRKQVTSFEIKDNRMPCLAPPIGKQKPRGDWRL
jgi:predicted phage terminase large subunit-like protein